MPNQCFNQFANNCSVGNSQEYNLTDDLGQEGNILKVRTPFMLNTYCCELITIMLHHTNLI